VKVLVTGGAGFLGKEIVKLLLNRGIEVRTLQRGTYTELDELDVEILTGDISDADTVLRASSGCDVIFHTAAKAGVWGSYESYYQPNVVGTRNVLDACKKNNIQTLVYTSSPSVVFGGEDEDGIDESAPYPDHFLSHYSATKAEAEKLVMAANSEKLSTVSLRPHLIWGPGDKHIYPRIIERAKTGRLKLIDNNNKLVDTTYITNAAHAHMLAFDNLMNDKTCTGKTYFISNGEPLPMSEIINRFLKITGMPPITKKVSPNLAYAIGVIMETVYKLLNITSEPFMTRFVAKQLSVAHWYDLSAAKKDLGYQPLVDIDEGMDLLEKSLAKDS